MNDVPRVAVFSELPTPYRWPLFRALGRRDDLDLSVFFYTRTEADRDWGIDVDESPDARPRTAFLPVRTFHVRGRRSLYFHWNPAVRGVVRDGGFDVAVVPGWSMPSTVAAIRACRRHAVPYVMFSETNALSRRPAWWRAAKRPYLRWAVGGADAWLATGTPSADFLVEHGADRARVFRFPNSPDVEALARDVDAARTGSAAWRRERGIADDAFVVVFVGRLIGAKDPATLALAAIRAGERTARPVRLVVVGDGPLLPELEGLARESAGRVQLTGALRPERLPQLWAAADAFALPSVHEPWGAVVNEAMAAGLPLLLSDRVGAGPDLLSDGENGLLLPAGDVERWAGALRTLASDPALCRRMGAASSVRVAEWGHAAAQRGFVDAVAAARRRG